MDTNWSTLVRVSVFGDIVVKGMNAQVDLISVASVDFEFELVN
jgi:hypothetical protein